MTRLLLCMRLYLVSCALCAQVDDVSIRSITTLDGLSHNDVECVFQDSRGFIWLGTIDGLNRYDGHTFQTFQMEPGGDGSLPSNIVVFISEDENHILWIGTRQRTVSYYDLKTDRFVPTEELPPQYQLPPDFVFWGVAHMGNGEHWICGKGDILISSPTGIRSLKKEGILPSSMEIEVPNIASPHPDSVWVVVESGKLFCLSRDANRRQNVQVMFYPNYVTANDLKWYKQGVILGSNEGLFVIMPGYTRPVKVNGRVSTSLHIQANTLWVGSSEGIWTYPLDSLLALPSEESLIPPLATPNNYGKRVPQITGHIYDIHADRCGSMWLGTKGDGLIQVNTLPGKFHYYPLGGDSRIRKRIRAIAEDHQGRIWVGSDGKGMFQLVSLPDGRRQLQAVSSSYASDRLIYRLYEFTVQGHPYLLQGTHYPSRPKIFDTRGDSLVESSAFTKILSQKGYFTDIKQDSPWIWISAYSRGIYRYNYVSDEITDLRMPGDTGKLTDYKPRSLLVDRHGRLWIGTSKGLIMIPTREKAKASPQMKIFRHSPGVAHSLSHDYILPLLESAQGEIWIGTMGGGLNRWIDSSQTFEHWTTADGLPSNTLKGILEDAQGNLWISSHKGLSQFQPDEGRFINYSPSDGLQDYEFADLACWKSRTGEMFFGGVRGLNAFFPEHIRQDTSVSSVILTDLHVLNERVAPKQQVNGRTLLASHLHEASHLRLRHDEHTFTLSFVGLNYQSPKKVHYQYRLEGLDQSWIQTDATARFAKYTKIPPGKYRFQVQASNTDGIWNGPIKTLPITITPPWWKSHAAYAVYLLIVAFFIVFFQQYSLIRIQRKNELVMQAFEKEKVQELAQMKLQFFTNVSHELRTPLTLIQGYVDKMSATSTPRPRDLNIIRRNTRILLRLISELMELQKLDQGVETLQFVSCDLVELVRRSLASFEWWAEQRETQLELSAPDHAVNVWVDPAKIEGVMYNLLSNAFKHTPKGGRISVVVIEKEQEVSLSIQDTGAGIPQADQPSIFKRFYQATKVNELRRMGTGIGLAYAKAIAERHHGTLAFESAEGVGTTFFLVLPKGAKGPHIDEEALPRHAQSLVERDGQTTSEEVEPPLVEPLGEQTPHLLLVEDNVQIRVMLKELLGQQYHVHEAEEGQAALTFCREQQPDLIISDVMMPGMDGFAFCAALKEDKAISHIPVILLTAKGAPEMKKRGFEHGADAYVTKPFDIAVLQAQIKAVMDSRRKLTDKINESGYKIELKDGDIASTEAQFMEEVVKAMEAYVEDSGFSVGQFAECLNMSRPTFNRRLKAMTGHTALGFMRDYRIKRAAQLLAQGSLSVKEVFFQSGIANMKSFRTYFKQVYGMTPRKYQEKNRTYHKCVARSDK